MNDVYVWSFWIMLVSLVGWFVIYANEGLEPSLSAQYGKAVLRGIAIGGGFMMFYSQFFMS